MQLQRTEVIDIYIYIYITFSTLVVSLVLLSWSLLHQSLSHVPAMVGVKRYWKAWWRSLESQQKGGQWNPRKNNLFSIGQVLQKVHNEFLELNFFRFSEVQYNRNRISSSTSEELFPALPSTSSRFSGTGPTSKIVAFYCSYIKPLDPCDKTGNCVTAQFHRR